MKNHFFFPWAGNKREEVERLYNNIDLTNIKTIVEPFCGSSAFSYYISTLHPKKFNYILNDNDEHLIYLYNLFKNKELIIQTEKEINETMEKIKNKLDYDTQIKNKNWMSWFIGHKIYTIRPYLYKLTYKYDKEKPFKFSDYPIYNFLISENIEIKKNDALEIIEEYKNNNENFIFLDPPYLIACNDFYNNNNVNIYEWLYNNNIRQLNSQIILILEKNWIIELLFKDYNKIYYNKLYQTSKKHTEHILIKNF